MTTVTIPAPVGEILKTLEAAGYGAWCVGGCVRDALLDRMPGDWDVTTSARPEETMALFAGRAVPTGLRHGTVTVKVNVKSEVTIRDIGVFGVKKEKFSTAAAGVKTLGLTAGNHTHTLGHDGTLEQL